MSIDVTNRYGVQQETGTVVLNEWVSTRYKHLVLRAPQSAAAAMAGQFFYLRCAPAPVPLMRRPMSIYRMDRDRGELHFLYLVKGEGTKLLAALDAGDTLNILGPLGNGFHVSNSWSHIVVLARGVGLATLANLAELAQGKGVKTTAILSARTRREVLSEDYMKSVGAHVHVVTDEEDTSHVDSVSQMLRTIVESRPVDAVFTCGSRRLTKLLQTISHEYNLPGQVALEEHMGCAMGVCFCCVRPFQQNDTLKYLRVCREGPVFPLSEVIVE